MRLSLRKIICRATCARNLSKKKKKLLFFFFNTRYCVHVILREEKCSNVHENSDKRGELVCAMWLEYNISANFNG